MKNRKIALATNFIVFQVGWFICITQPQIIALVFTIGALALHFLFIGSKSEIQLFIKMVIVGFSLDSALQIMQIMDFRGADFIQPFWLFCLWLLFTTTIRHSLLWLFENKYIAMIAGAIFGPIPYIIGSQLGAALIVSPLFITILILSISWAIVMYILYLDSHELLQANKTT